MIKYCARCVMPDTRPDLFLDNEGVCNACRSFESRTAVDWSVRRKELEVLLDKYRSKNASNWDCIVPVSGGKDSTFQVIRMLQLGHEPAVRHGDDLRSFRGRPREYPEHQGTRRRLRGVLAESDRPRRKLNRIGLSQVGDIAWPEHVGIFTIPVRAAVQYNVPMIVWGENSQNEYGGPAAASENNVLDRRWLEEFGGLLGLARFRSDRRSTAFEQKI